MKKFYAKYGELTPEQWLVQAIHGQTDFSFSVPSIPNEDFLPNFKQKYEFYFIRLDATTGQMSELKDHSSFGKAANLNSHHISATNTASEAALSGDGNVGLDDMNVSWFVDYNGGDFHLATPPAIIATAALWEDGDPLTDIDGDLRPRTVGAPDVAGADIR